MTTTQVRTLSEQIGRFAAELTLADIPTEVVERARHLALDAVGLAFVTAAEGFADVAAATLSSFGSGDTPVLGRRERLPQRDAAILDGVLIHGLDFDDTHLAAVTHVSASALPAALTSAYAADTSTDDLLLAYILGIEITARVGLGGAGAFHDVGFHPTAVAGAFGAATAAAKVRGLDAAGIGTAQAIVGSMSAGLLEFLEDGAWTKRLHPGWAANAGITAAGFAQHGWTGPAKVYEGRFGLYATHLQSGAGQPDSVADGLGERWEVMGTAVKPYAACHFTHAFIDAALELRRSGIDTAEIVRITAGIHPVPGKIIAEPLDAKRIPASAYEAQFSLPFTVAAAFVNDRFSLAEIDEKARGDATILALAQRVDVVEDPESAFPDAYSGILRIELADGSVRTHREQVNRGHPSLPLTNDQVKDKFRANMSLCADDAVRDRVESAVLALGDGDSARAFAQTCAAG